MSPDVPINGRVLRWARESGGVELDDLAKKTEIPASTLLAWESGGGSPRYAQLKKIAGALKRPLAAFLLNEPPKEEELVQFRTLQGASDELTPDSRLALRVARRWQRIAGELLEETGRRTRRVALPRAKLTDDPEDLGRRLRRVLKLDASWPASAANPTEAFAIARQAVEAAGILVFQLAFPVTDARGFSLQHARAPVIGISKKDELVARSFSLFHELCHLMLGEGGICVADPSHMTKDKDVEQFCNRVAAEAILPRDLLVAEIGDKPITETRIRSIAKALKVSKYVVARRCLTFGIIDKAQHSTWVRLWQVRDASDEDDGGPHVPWHERYLKERGVYFLSLVFDAEARNIISRADVLNYLGVKERHIEPMQELLLEGGVALAG